MGSFTIQNFGCRVNQAEAFNWVAALRRDGLTYEPDSRRAGIVVVNSCTLTSRADRDVRKFIRQVSRRNPEARILVTGCLAERLPVETAALPGVWKVIPNSEKEAFPEMLRDWALSLDGRRRGSREHSALSERPYRRRAFLKIQDGCGMRCAFCVIPLVRGRSRSVPSAAVLARLKDLAEGGFREAVLTGINLASYGRDLEPEASLAGMLRDAEHAPGDIRIRLSSLDPRLVGPELIDLAAASAKIRPHFHLSLQHAAERILRAMGRSGSAEGYLRILGRLRERSPRAALGADIIAGFPGETDEDFRMVEEFLEASPLTSIHVFSYSSRPGTPAADLPRLDDRIRKHRADRLRAFGRGRDLRFRREQEGRIEEAVVISRRGMQAAALTANGINVRVTRCDAPEGEAVRVRIGRADEGGTAGEIVTATGTA
jgi:threonylcarbamoyladenosine tRNA methylthiotransferase MtaB